MRKWVVPLMAMGALLTVVGLAWAYTNGMGSSRERAEREHGVNLPDTAQFFRCQGDAWGGFMDSGATALFSVPAPNLDELIEQLEILSSDAVAAMPISSDDVSRYLREYGSIARASDELRELRIVKSLTARSTRGDTLSVRVWETPDQLFAVCMHTDWN